MKNILKYPLLVLAGVVALTVAGCGGGGGGSSPATGPSGAASFAGSSISFNPTINFQAGNALTYLNTEAGSPFPAAAVETDGTYTYVPNANYTAGTLTLTVDGIDDPIVLEISDFIRNGANVTGFTARSGGQNYPVTVTGTLPAYQPASGGGGGSGESRADDIPAGWQGSHTLTFGEANSGSGIADGTTTTFTLAARTLSFDGKTLTDPIWYNDNQYEYIFKDGNIWYAVSGSDAALNEINIQGPYTGNWQTTFYGQYNDGSNGDSAGVTVTDDGKYASGSVFYANVTNTVGPVTVPSGSHLSVLEISNSEPLKLEIANNGDLILGNYLAIIPFSAVDVSNVVFVKVREDGSDTVTIHKNAGTGLPTDVSIYSVRNSISPIKTTTVTYTLEVAAE